MQNEHHETLNAADSKDSALQYVDFQLFEDDDLSADERREILSPVEAEVKRNMSDAMRQGMETAFRSGAFAGAEHAIDTLKDNLSYHEVPEDHRDKVAELTERRLDEKHNQLAEVFDDLRHDALKRATVIPEDIIANWGPVV